MSSSDPNSELPSGVVLPTMDDIPRAGTSAQQIALQDRAWAALETYATPSGLIRTRLANAWLGEHRWNVQIVPHFLMREKEWVEPLVTEARRRGLDALLGTVVEPDDLRISAVWRMPTDPDHLARFFQAHYAGFHMLYPEDLSFAVHANDGDYAVHAGPEGFVRAALPPEAIGPGATEAVKAEIERGHGEACVDGILAHCRPFMLG